MTTIDKYARAKERRDAHTAAILASKARFKVVVAGPGTGKTFLFKKVLEGKQKSLTLSFINALVDDLSIELYGLSEVRTLHSFARSLLGKLWKRKDIKVFPRLADVIQADLHILHGVDVDFAEIFNTRDDANAHLEFYRQRKKYYNESYGYTDIVFAAVRYLEEHPDQIPVYDQVVVDEFQDFNLLEASLIDLLAQKSPMLLAGDDDQALYDFKHADPAHIRKLHAEGSDYESFNLPLCSRCTRVPSEWRVTLPALQKECAKCGVAVVVARCVPGCAASGATCTLENGTALLLLSARFLSDDQFWFSFFHEAGHLLLHPNEACVEEREADTTIEHEANAFAQEVILDPLGNDELMAIEPNKFSIARFARGCRVSAGLIVGQLQHRKKISHSSYSAMKIHYSAKDFTL